MIEPILAVLVLVGFLVWWINRQPSEFRVTRTITMTSSPAAIFPHVNSLRAWDAWSPWAKLDPDAKNTLSGPDEGVGATMQWAGNRKVGEGSMTITESRPHELVGLKLQFIKPMPGTSVVEFTFTPEGDHTRVSWSMAGTNNFIAKAMSLVFNCEKMIGTQFEKGLNNLRAVVEPGVAIRY